MKIALMTAGNVTYSAQLAQGLASGNNRVLFIGLRGELNSLRRDFPRFIDRSSFRMHAIRHGSPLAITRWSSLVGTIARLHGFGPDILHIANSSPVSESLLLARYARSMGVAVVTTLHDTRIHPGDLFPLRRMHVIRRIIEASTHIIVHGRCIAKTAEKTLAIEPSRISIVPHGNYDIYLEHASSRLPSPPRGADFLFYGRMKRYKGLDILLRAAPLVKSAVPDARIIIAGQGPELQRMRANLNGNTLFEIHEGFIPVEQTARLFERSLAVILPYIEASQSGPLCLAFSFGRPVIASSVGALAELITHEREGLLVPASDHIALANAMITLAGHPAMAKRMSLAARRSADTGIDWGKTVAEQTLSVYRRAIEHKPRSQIGRDASQRRQRGAMVNLYYREYSRECVGQNDRP